MNPLIQFRKSIALCLIVLVLACFAISPMAQAVVPAPDGGYPGNNTAEGTQALQSRTDGGPKYRARFSGALFQHCG